MNNIKTLKTIVFILTVILVALSICFTNYYSEQKDKYKLFNPIPVTSFATSTTVVPSVPLVHTISEAILIATSSMPQAGSLLELLFPKGDEFLCRGENRNISWRGAQGFSSIDISIVSNSADGSTTYPLGNFPSSYNEAGEKNGEGTYIWKAGYTSSGIELSLDKTYQISISGCYFSPVGNSCRILPVKSNPFSFLDCRG